MSKLSDVLSLIKSGYTKKQIEELYKNVESEPETKPVSEPESKETQLTTLDKRLVDNTTVEQVNALINGLTKEVEELRKAQQSINREGLSGKDSKPETADDILSSILDSNESDK